MPTFGVPDPGRAPRMDHATLTDRLRAEAADLGFDRLGIAPAVAPPGYERFRDWLAKGHAAGMGYLDRLADARSHPSHVLEGVRSIVVAAIVYGSDRPEGRSPTRGKVARYARGSDYHDLFWDRLGTLLGRLREAEPNLRGRAVADSAPLLERDFARLAGLGWIGKNTMLIDRKLGSFTLLGALLIDAELVYDPPFEADHCGSCTRCLDACPTGAFVGPYELDARRCLSYWTIEHRGVIPDPIASALDGWAFGCDVCQDVCPWNRKAPAGREPALMPIDDLDNPDLIAWLDADPAGFSKRIKRSALSRAKRSGLVRNAALVLGGRRVAEAVPALIWRLRDDVDPVVRWASAWALRAIGGELARAALEAAREGDPDPTVREEAGRAS